MLSAVVITKNEARNVAKCLASLAGIADEIIVVDSYSTDETEEICKKFGVLFFQRAWEGYSATKNRGNGLAHNDWILSLDADEELSPELRESILDLKKQAGRQCFYSFNRLTNYCGQWIWHGGWYPDTKPRMFDRRIAKWEGDIHEKLVYPEAIRPVHLKGNLFHYSFGSIAQHVAKMNHYSSLSANEKTAKGKKASMAKMLFGPPANFFKFYILRAGFLDGKAGFIIAVISSYYTFLKSAKTWTAGSKANSE